MSAKRTKEFAGEPDKCDVCGVKLAPHMSMATREYLGDVFTFCSEACAGEFVKDPKRFEDLSEEDEDA